jgi:hypothetical protein
MATEARPATTAILLMTCMFSKVIGMLVLRLIELLM